jgi:exodeoxyribonuclease VII large subunit
MAEKARKTGQSDEGAEPPRQLGLDWLIAPAPAPAPAPSSSSPIPPVPVPPSVAPGPIAPGPARAPPLAVEPPAATAARPDEAPRAPRVYAVGELVRAARLTLESRFAEVRVEGEVSGFRRSGPGHLYFCLKDDQASLDCVMYAREAARLKFQLDDGMAVRVRGRLTIYEGRGRFQLTVAAIEPTGAGALALAFEQLKQKLEAEGLFAPARKRKLPFLPRCLGVVTSREGAVIRDIIRVAHRRFPVTILLAPTPVQGPGAAGSIVAALARIARVPGVDVVIVARGGGSIEDLWPFNEEIVARAIAAAPVPVISAVGHEIDFTIADFVADVRAPTASAAAELAVPVMGDLRGELDLCCRRAGRSAAARLGQGRLALERARARLGDPRRLVDERRQLVDELAARIERPLGRRLSRHRAELGTLELALSRSHPRRRIADRRAALAELGQKLGTVVRRSLGRRRAPVDALAHKLDALSPRRVLERGYSLTFRPDGHLLGSPTEVTAGDRLRVVVHAGALTAIVEEKADGDAGGAGGTERTE